MGGVSWIGEKEREEGEGGEGGTNGMIALCLFEFGYREGFFIKVAQGSGM